MIISLGAQNNRMRNKRILRRYAYLLSVICITCSIPGCLSKQVRNVGLEPQARIIENTKYRILGDSEGQSSSFNLLWIIPVTPRIDYDRAVNEAIGNLRGDNLIEVQTWLERQYWIVGMVEILHVKGKVIQYEK